ncbi:DUF3995 domain-containing protein [Pseudoclavibacter sp. RFBA6]|uniref:DUF3995 domain-containing protein n=1 Tax=Pseudoclavibacter sp. RFBA6 TaxID=2080573 RepID=UPI000CE85A0A|nr:DUF3995 domain-containing protein [Pseudoclavibacter sp. RFBA6]PPG43400.1 DUF3995 domain-containing protein [Pseudoclavibacter sp. RFBA6]
MGDGTSSDRAARTSRSPRISSTRRTARSLVLVAAAIGLVHAAFSAYWAFGGTWLLSTIGAIAVEFSRREPLESGLMLGAVALVKALAALIPVAVDAQRMPWPRAWRVICWVGGPGIVLYGLVNSVVSSAVLLGILVPEGGYDRDAMVGHALLWDPLFLSWGLALTGWLWLTRAATLSASGLSAQ